MKLPKKAGVAKRAFFASAFVLVTHSEASAGVSCQGIYRESRERSSRNGLALMCRACALTRARCSPSKVTGANICDLECILVFALCIAGELSECLDDCHLHTATKCSLL
jgi:hypothetical protein